MIVIKSGVLKQVNNSYLLICDCVNANITLSGHSNTHRSQIHFERWFTFYYRFSPIVLQTQPSPEYSRPMIIRTNKFTQSPIPPLRPLPHPLHRLPLLPLRSSLVGLHKGAIDSCLDLSPAHTYHLSCCAPCPRLCVQCPIRSRG